MQSQTDSNESKRAQKLLSHKDQVQSYRMLACKELREHCTRSAAQTSSSSNSNENETHSQTAVQVDSERVERLLVRVSSLKKLNTSIMEELFFNDVIGNVQIDSLIPSIIGSEIGDTVKEEI